MKTETVGVTELECGNKVELLGSTYEVTYLDTIENSTDIHLIEVIGRNQICLDALGHATFERVLPDPEEYRVRSVAMPDSFWTELATSPVDPKYVMITTHSLVEEPVCMAVYKADLKAVVEKL